MSAVPITVFQEPVFGSSFTSNPNKRKLPKEPKEPTIKRLKSEFAQFAARSVKEKKNYRYSTIVELGGAPEKLRTMPLPLRKKIDAAKKKREQKDIELGKLDARSVAKNKKKNKNNRSRKKAKKPS